MDGRLEMRGTDRTAKIAAMLVLGLLAVQFALGMDVNLFVHLPGTGNSVGMRGMMGAMAGSPALMVHMMLGFLLAILALVAVLTAATTGRGSVLVSSIVGALGIVVAGLGGIRFMMYGQGNLASFVMAIGFLVALLAFVFELLVLPGREQERASTRHRSLADS